ncbi:MAG: hypothetical protein WC931_04320 [Bacilli bacterium]|jgi:hypothetical protein
MTERHIQNQRRRSFELEEDERYHSAQRTVVCRNEGDEDSLLYGSLDLDDRDSFEGFGVSAEREAEQSDQPEWTVLVNSYDSFKYLRAQEQLCSKAKDALSSYQQQIEAIEGELEGLRQEARDMKKAFGSIDPAVVSRGQRLASRLSDLKEIEEHYRQLIDSASDNLRRVEAAKRPEADAVAPEEGDYNTVHWNACYLWGQAQIDRLGWQLSRLKNPAIAKMISQVQSKRFRMELTFEHYVHLLGILNAELHRRTGGANFLAKRNKMADLWIKHNLAARKNTDTCVEGDEILFDPSERQYGETKLTENELVTAIDLRAAASRIAARHKVTFDEAITMLTAETN